MSLRRERGRPHHAANYSNVLRTAVFASNAKELHKSDLGVGGKQGHNARGCFLYPKNCKALYTLGVVTYIQECTKIHNLECLFSPWCLHRTNREELLLFVVLLLCIYSW